MLLVAAPANDSFEGVEAIKRAVTTERKGIPEESFQQCIEA